MAVGGNSALGGVSTVPIWDGTSLYFDPAGKALSFLDPRLNAVIYT